MLSGYSRHLNSRHLWGFFINSNQLSLPGCFAHDTFTTWSLDQRLCCDCLQKIKTNNQTQSEHMSNTIWPSHFSPVSRIFTLENKILDKAVSFFFCLFVWGWLSCNGWVNHQISTQPQGKTSCKKTHKQAPIEDSCSKVLAKASQRGNSASGDVYGSRNQAAVAYKGFSTKYCNIFYQGNPLLLSPWNEEWFYKRYPHFLHYIFFSTA